jgi:hypothetical protein
LSEIFTQVFQRSATEPSGSRLESTWVDEAEDEIDRLFGTR